MANGRHFKSETPRASQPMPMIPATRAHGASGGSSRRPSGPAGSRNPHSKMPLKPIAMAVLALAVVGVAISGVVAWLTASGMLENTFGRGQVDVTVNEEFDGEITKKNVFVTNDGNVPVYVRAQVNIYWVDKDGNQLWDTPVVDKDYKITWFDISSKWMQGDDGFYYWTEPLVTEGQTANLIKTLTDQGKYTDGRKLVCDVAVQAIQADPADAVKEAWKPAVTDVSNDGTLTITPKAGA